MWAFGGEIKNPLTRSGFKIRWRDNDSPEPSVTSTPQLLDIVQYRKLPAYTSQSYLQQKYVVEGLSLAQIAKENFTSKHMIRAGLKRFGIPLRPAHNTRLRNASVRFGRRRVRGLQVEVKTEQRVIDAVSEMWDKGMSLREIAKVLTKMGVATKEQGRGWHPQMVNRLLNID